MFLQAGSEDSDQTGRLPRLIRVFAGRTGYFVGFLMRWLITYLSSDRCQLTTASHEQHMVPNTYMHVIKTLKASIETLSEPNKFQMDLFICLGFNCSFNNITIYSCSPKI